MRLDVLIVDDDPGPQQSIRMIIKDDHDVRLADNGREALQKVAQQVPDLVFLDLRMPEMSGVEVLRLLNEKYTDIQVAIVTAYADVETAQSAVRYGAMDYLTKPAAVAEVLRVVERAKDRKLRQHDTKLLIAQLSEATGVLADQVQNLQGDEKDEVDGLVRDLKGMGASINSEMVDMEHLQELGQVAAEVGHDINNLLHVITLQIEGVLVDLELSGDRELPGMAERLRKIKTAAFEASQSTRRIREYARAKVTANEYIADLRQLVVTAVEMSEVTCENEEEGEEANRRVVYQLSEVPGVMGDAAALRTMVINLINNSCHATREGGEVWVRTGTEGGQAVLEVRDSGCGMAAEVLEQTLQPFYTTKGSRGTGLGLPIVARMVKQHGGKLEIASEEGIGTVVTVRLPAAVGAAEVIVEECLVPDGPRVMVIDNDERMVDLIEQRLTAEGHEVLAFLSGEASWEWFSERVAEGCDGVTIAFVDYGMPGMSGLELAQRLKELKPSLSVVLLTGYPNDYPRQHLDEVLYKPFQFERVLELVTEAWERQRELEQSNAE
jgi:signal transduction histidine kinase